MGYAIAVLVFFALLAVVALVVLAAIAAIVEILPPLRNQDADDRGAGTPVAATMAPRRWLANWHPRKPHTRFGH
ncbi:MAG TPA: hypothetical protein VKB72_01695 [Steroidobacteraceae bacterium]|nr:hypothetical protein [Steroidobacteraceae bacterium]